MINKFDEFNIHKICKEYGIKNYTINNGIVDVDGNVELVNKKLTRLPLDFGNVSGTFFCSYNNLTNLQGAPDYVGGNFYCNNNQLTNLEGSPKQVGGHFFCSYNNLTNLQGAPREVGGDFLCDSNQLTTLEGAPIEVGGDLYCYKNPLPEEIINFKDIKYIVKWQDEYNIWRKGKLDLFRFNELIKDYDK